MNNISDDKRNAIRQLLEEYLPAERDIVGERDIDLMIDSPTELIEFSYGSELSFYEAYKTAADFVSFIADCITMYTASRPQNNAQIQERDKKITELIETREIRTITIGDKTEIVEKIKMHYRITE